jgi:hypothetical protein
METYTNLPSLTEVLWCPQARTYWFKEFRKPLAQCQKTCKKAASSYTKRFVKVAGK